MKVEDEDKIPRLILPLSSSYEHMKLILMYEKETLKYADVTEKLLSKEKRLECNNYTFVIGGNSFDMLEREKENLTEDTGMLEVCSLGMSTCYM